MKRRNWLITLFVLLLPLGAVASEAARTALVFGGTGRLGAPIVEQLLTAEYTVTVFARPTSDTQRLEGLAVNYVSGDLTDGESVVAALTADGYDLVVDASARRTPDDPFYADAMRNILVALDGREVGHFILHGSVGAGDNRDEFPDVDFSRFAAAMDAKGEAETMLIESGIPWTIIRNGLVKPAGSGPTREAFLSEDTTILSPVTREDLALLTLECANQSACFGKLYHAVDRSLSFR